MPLSPAAAFVSVAPVGGLPPLGAIGVETLISIAVLLMGVVGWIVQMAQQGKAQQAARRPNAGQARNAAQRGGNADEKLRSEIDSFLEEVAGRRGQKRPEKRANAPQQNRGPVDPFEEPPRRSTPPRPSDHDRPDRERDRSVRERPDREDVPDFLRPAARRGDKSDLRPVQRTPEEVGPPTPPPSKRQNLRERHLTRLKKKNLGSHLREHVEQYMAVDKDELAREHVQVKDRLSATERELAGLKRRLADPNDSTRLRSDDESEGSRSPVGAADADRLRTLLSDPDGVREAIMVNELLAKPLGLRTDRGPAGRGHGATNPARIDPAAIGASPDAA